MMSSNPADLSCSPRAVIDMRLFEVDEEKLMENMECLRTPMSLLPILSVSNANDNADSITESSLPPLNTLSVCSSSANNDDSSSVSSVSLDDDNWDTPSTASLERRCIFAAYWNKKGGRPKTLHIPSSQDQDLKNGMSLSSSAGDHSYEHLLEKNEAPGVRRDSSASCGSGSIRRRLWDNRYVAQSEPSLVEFLDCKRPIRKTRSAPVVGPVSPCLRKGRFSSSAAETKPPRRSSDTSVSFSDDVQVKYLKPTMENYAARGWSQLFV